MQKRLVSLGGRRPKPTHAVLKVDVLGTAQAFVFVQIIQPLCGASRVRKHETAVEPVEDIA